MFSPRRQRGPSRLATTPVGAWCEPMWNHRSMQVVPITTFRTHFDSLMEAVERGDREMLITRGGRPVAKVSSVTRPEPLAGSVTFHVDDDELIAPLA